MKKSASDRRMIEALEDMRMNEQLEAASALRRHPYLSTFDLMEYEACAAAEEAESFELWASTARPCHSIHCRHYDLATGFPCFEEVRRARANRKGR